MNVANCGNLYADTFKVAVDLQARSEPIGFGVVVKNFLQYLKTIGMHFG